MSSTGASVHPTNHVAKIYEAVLVPHVKLNQSDFEASRSSFKECHNRDILISKAFVRVPEVKSTHRVV